MTCLSCLIVRNRAASVSHHLRESILGHVLTANIPEKLEYLREKILSDLLPNNYDECAYVDPRNGESDGEEILDSEQELAGTQLHIGFFALI